jgi:tetratricopeptide (TPR) repeat protein
MNEARALQDRPLDTLNRLIEETDSRLGAMERSSGAEALTVLQMLDEMDSLHTELTREGVDLRTAESRIGTIQLILRRKAALVLRLLGQRGGIAALRATRAPVRQRWWWYLDEYVAEQRKRSLLGMARVGIILIVIIAAAAFIYQTWFPPDPVASARMGYTGAAQRAIEAGDLDLALRGIDKGAAELPNDGEILLWRGTILSLMKRTQEADSAFQAARAAYSDELTYLITRATVRTQANDIAGAYADALSATTLYPDSGQAFLVLGGAQELSGQSQKATQSYSTAATLAAAANDTQLEAMAKVRMAMLMQNGGSLFPAPQATP